MGSSIGSSSSLMGRRSALLARSSSSLGLHAAAASTRKMAGVGVMGATAPPVPAPSAGMIPAGTALPSAGAAAGAAAGVGAGRPLQLKHLSKLRLLPVALQQPRMSSVGIAGATAASAAAAAAAVGMAARQPTALAVPVPVLTGGSSLRRMVVLSAHHHSQRKLRSSLARAAAVGSLSAMGAAGSRDAVQSTQDASSSSMPAKLLQPLETMPTIAEEVHLEGRQASDCSATSLEGSSAVGPADGENSIAHADADAAAAAGETVSVTEEEAARGLPEPAGQLRFLSKSSAFDLDSERFRRRLTTASTAATLISAAEAASSLSGDVLPASSDSSSAAAAAEAAASSDLQANFSEREASLQKLQLYCFFLNYVAAVIYTLGAGLYMSPLAAMLIAGDAAWAFGSVLLAVASVMDLYAGTALETLSRSREEVMRDAQKQQERKASSGAASMIAGAGHSDSLLSEAPVLVRMQMMPQQEAARA